MTDTDIKASTEALFEGCVSRAEARRALILSRRNDAKLICQPVLQFVERVKEENQADSTL